MNAVTDAGTAGGVASATAPGKAAGGAAARTPVVRDSGMLISLAVAAAAGVALVVTARLGATPLLVAVAVLQAALAVAWIVGTRHPGRIGGLVICALAAAGTDVAFSVWPQGRLGAAVAVLGLALPAMFAHQLTRGAARVHVVSSLSGIALLVFAMTALPAFLQLRHEFDTPAHAGAAVAAAAGAIAAALVVGYLVDLLVPLPRFDPAVARGLPAVLVSAAVGAAFGYLSLRNEAAGRDFTDGRAAFVGVALGALAALLSVGASFVERATAVAAGPSGRPEPVLHPVLRRAVAALLPLCVLAPVAFLLCLAVRP